MSLLVKGEGLTLVRGGRLLFEALDFALAEGEAVHVTGANGSGKSSLIRLVAGLLAPTVGRIERAEAALADEGLALDPEIPLGRALAFWGSPGIEQSAAFFGLSALAQIPVRLLSTGQAKRARLALVKASGARLWLLDEPLNGLDSQGIDALACAIAQHRKAGGAVLAANHGQLSGKWREVAL